MKVVQQTIKIFIAWHPASTYSNVFINVTLTQPPTVNNIHGLISGGKMHILADYTLLQVFTTHANHTCPDQWS